MGSLEHEVTSSRGSLSQRDGERPNNASECNDFGLSLFSFVFLQQTNSLSSSPTCFAMILLRLRAIMLVYTELSTGEVSGALLSFHIWSSMLGK